VHDDPLLARTSIDTIRTLAMDAVEKAGCGHPGTPMALAPLAYVLWTRVMKYDASDPDWPDRDRFVLSAGHASMLLYAALHLTGYPLSLKDLEAFRQWGAKTPGHPEHGHTAGVETTTGPLGQGFANAVGMALCERMLAARHGSLGLVDHRTWVIASDGDLMEGVASEAASLAGHLGLERLCVFYDDNRITIDGSTSLAFTEDVGKRFEAYGWNVRRLADTATLDEIAAAAEAARAPTGKPTLVICRTHIGYGSPNKQDTAKAHGEALGADEVRKTKQAYGWPADAQFLVPDDVREHLRAAGRRGQTASRAWRERLAAARASSPAEARAFEDALAGRVGFDWAKVAPQVLAGVPAGAKAMSTRKASGLAIQAIAAAMPALVGGSADLAGSNVTPIAKGGDVQKGAYGGRNLYFGVREHAMASMLNGIALHGGLRPYAGTFFVFTDYMRPALRLAALMRLPVVHVLTHDSIGLGEDGPTHQPVEHLASLRAMPGMTVIRPADATETFEAWRMAIENAGPTCLVLTRQDVPVLDRGALAPASGTRRGGYVLRDAEGGASKGDPDVVLIATGSEVAVALGAADLLAREGVRARVVSFPCSSVFAEQDESYRAEVLPDAVPRVAVEAAASFGWERWVGRDGAVVALDRFGASAPGPRLMQELGFTADHVARVARECLARDPR
jgi:transketolase